MFSIKESLQFININQDYLKYMNSFCSEVYYKPTNYDNKPYLGILLNQNGIEYVIPLTSAKEKHKSWKNVESDRFLKILQNLLYLKKQFLLEIKMELLSIFFQPLI